MYIPRDFGDPVRNFWNLVNDAILTLHEPDVSPLQLQGPRSREIMRELLGDGVPDLRYFRLRELELAGIPLVVSRTGWSTRTWTRSSSARRRCGAFGTPA